MPRKKGGGGKLTRSEIIQARLDPKLHMAAEIMARTERRTLSSFIERSIEQAARNNKVRRNLMFLWWVENSERFYVGRPTSDTVSVEKAVQDIGNEHEGIRFLNFATYFPDLLNNDERQIFNDIVLTPYFWLHYPYRVEDKNGKYIKTEWGIVEALEGLDKRNLIEYWDKLKSQKVDFLELVKLPHGKKIDHPLNEDVRAIRKKILHNKSGTSFEVIFVNQIQSIEIPPDDVLWKRHTKNLTAKKIELKKSEEGSQVIATFFLEGESGLTWFESLMKKMEK